MGSSTSSNGSNKEDLDSTKVNSNPSSSRSSSIDSHSPTNLAGYKTPTDSTPPQSISPPSSTDVGDENQLNQQHPRAPASISSMNVETGSISGDSFQENGNDTPTSLSAYASPVSSPIVEPTTFPSSSDDPSSITLDHDSNLNSSTLKGPLAHLKEPVRTSSAVSVSSLIVEDGSQATEGVANLDEVDNVTLNAERKNSSDEIPTSVGEDSSTIEIEEVVEHSEENEELREAQTKQELERYEGEVEDLTVAPDVPLQTRQTIPIQESTQEPEVEERQERVLKTPEPNETEQKKHDTPVLSTFTSLGATDGFPTSVSLASLSSLTSNQTMESDIGDIKLGSGSDVTPQLTPKLGLNDELAEGETISASNAEFGGLLKDLSISPSSTSVPIIQHELVVDPPTPGMPRVKCNDCSEEVDLMQLADHTCKSSSLPPAISSPLITSKTLPSLSTSTTYPDVPLDDDEEEPAVAGAYPSPKSTRFTTLSPARSAWTASNENQGSPTTAKKPSNTRLDDFSSQTQSLVPDDVGEENEDDEDFFNKPMTKSDSDSTFPTSFTGGNFPSMVGSQRLSQASSDSNTNRDLASWGSRGSIGGVPGVDDDDDELNYEGGSVTIVRTK